ncbi:hypothetical protein [Kitasatospora sp. NPDC057015]|uniref:hypothetical protein n=1 Tax=Kitasatospora sp. NPDC057015 TaxID=3346001 RepID=UPI003625D4D9
MLDKNAAAFDDDRGRSVRTGAHGDGADDARTDATAADPRRAGSGDTDERRPIERGPVEHRTNGKRANGQRLREQRADRHGEAEQQSEEPGEDAAIRSGHRPDEPGTPAAEPVIPRQPAAGDALDDRPGLAAGPTTGDRPAPAGHRTPPAPEALPAPVAPPAPKSPDGAADLSTWLETAQVQRLSAQWRTVQTGFVDDPRAAVEQADELVGKAADLVTASVRDHRSRLHKAGEGAGDTGIPTEELRLAMREYRTLLDRLLAA